MTWKTTVDGNKQLEIMNTSLTTYWRGMANGTRSGFSARLLTAALIPASLIYCLVQVIRARMYQAGMLTIHKLPRPVVSIGNITVGGTGKTPVTARIARVLLSQGLRVAVLSRGYGGTREGTTAVVSDGRELLLTPEECGDEPYLLASTVPGLMVVIGTDRHAAGLLAMEHVTPDIFLLDDGFQHLRLHRDLNILLLDHTHPLGNGWTLPAGLLREPESAAARADLVMYTRCPHEAKSAAAISAAPACTTHHELVDAVSLTDGKIYRLDSLIDKKILVFAGIADPDFFFDGLRTRGLNIIASVSLPDHVVYGDDVIATIEAALRESEADYAVTTEKDGVKLRHLPSRVAGKILLARLDLIIDDPAPLTSLLRNLLQK
jgi:tetraacyldisaccharide 4'-kinase